jgi:hypothetical protein
MNKKALWYAEVSRISGTLTTRYFINSKVMAYKHWSLISLVDEDENAKFKINKIWSYPNLILL